MGEDDLFHGMTKGTHKEVLGGMGFFQTGGLNLSFGGNALRRDGHR